MVDVDKVIDINERWEKGISHDNRSIEIFEFIKDYDFHFCNDFFCFKQGGDGDNGEHLMYLLDEFFANKDKQENSLKNNKDEDEKRESLDALREIDTHIRSTSNPVPYIVETLKRTLPEYKE